MNSKDSMYTWHLSLRVDRPVEGCNMRPHAYMYGKKLDERDMDKPLPPHTKMSREPPPNHEFSYRWFRGPHTEPCAYEGCPRRTSFSPHDWSKHALGGSGCSLQCISTQSSLYKSTFCNSNCFCQAWKTQYTVPRDTPQARGGSSGASTPVPNRSSASSVDGDDDRSVGSNYSVNSNGGNPPGTPRGFVGAYQSGLSFNDYGASSEYNDGGYGNQPQQQDEWVEISREQLFVPGPDDIGRKLKLEAAAYSVETGELLMHRVVKTDLVLSRAPEPAKRNLVTAKAGGGGSGGGARFRMVTYNVLAEIYATQQQYPYCDFWALSWDYRFQNILREIVDVCPDVVCLQEVQADHYENHIYNAMSDQGFEGVYKQKTRQSMGLAGKVDGCALFWRRTKFHLVESYSIEFNELAQRQATQVLGMNPRSEECIAYLNRLSKDNVAQLVVLELAQPPMSNRPNREPINQVCIANTHLYSNKDFPDVKLWQSWQLLQELETFVLSRGTSLPLMICGDFNSTPDTAVYDLLSRQAVHPGHPDVNMNNNDESCPQILPEPHAISHSFQLHSVYNMVLGEEPKLTNFTNQFKGVLDYMWYSSHNLKPLSAAPIPDEAVLTRHGEALPSTQYSSDHVMLISDMQILNGGSRPPV
uniref:Endonuclease/exonuclease/phosphatase domain-containing protein n=1 Tax=Helicotheca tamesis TaxID=374047 RepID=A0A7S2HZ61_9STRA|mmetsp:Transcript_4032/g.5456  ORF Transcript_4032/g.5456 Transcript_4032/m.5456 type:complete len:642 (+) Transcript_4032:173-2098(+)